MRTTEGTTKSLIQRKPTRRVIVSFLVDHLRDSVLDVGDSQDVVRHIRHCRIFSKNRITDNVSDVP